MSITSEGDYTDRDIAHDPDLAAEYAAEYDECDETCAYCAEQFAFYHEKEFDDPEHDH